jgi:hypothetical protein
MTIIKSENRLEKEKLNERESKNLANILFGDKIFK